MKEEACGSLKVPQTSRRLHSKYNLLPHRNITRWEWTSYRVDDSVEGRVGRVNAQACAKVGGEDNLVEVLHAVAAQLLRPLQRPLLLLHRRPRLVGQQPTFQIQNPDNSNPNSILAGQVHFKRGASTILIIDQTEKKAFCPDKLKYEIAYVAAVRAAAPKRKGDKTGRDWVG